MKVTRYGNPASRSMILEVMNLKIVVLAGGTSTERDVSLSSGNGVYNALKEKGHEVVLVDLYLGYETEKPLHQLFIEQLNCCGDIAKVGYVAVDRSVIPIHSYLYVVLDNGFVYGYCYAKDTGGAIKGNIIDIFLPTDEDCRYFGRLQGTVYVISSGS